MVSGREIAPTNEEEAPARCVANVEEDSLKDSLKVAAEGVNGGEKNAEPSVHYGEPGYNEYLEKDDVELDDVTWGEVCRSCCCHSPKEWGRIIVFVCILCFLLYWFIFSLELLGTGAKVLTGCVAGGLFGGNTNPIASLIVGMLVTVLLQSSSTTTSIIVSMVGSGAISVEPAIYMVMGANIGTSVTNTIVAMGQMGSGDELERAFAGATVHDMFNFLAVLVLLPLEVITHLLARLTAAMTKNFEPNADGSTQSKGIKVIISPILDRLIKANSKVVEDVAQGGNCTVYYPTQCNPAGTVNYEACVTNGRVGLITCSKDLGVCPAFFQEGASEKDDKLSGGISLFLGILFLVLCLIGLVAVLKKMLLGSSTRIIRKATQVNGYFSMLIGCAVTMAVQSSSVTTSVLTPLVGIGVVSVEQMYPLTLGCNVGTTITSILAALVADTSDAMQVALAHFFFNLFGIVIWYPVPLLRRVPIRLAKGLGKVTRWWRGFPLLYIAIAFFLIPLLLLGLSSLFVSDSKSLVVLGMILTIAIFLLLVKYLWWWFRNDGAAKTQACFERRQKKKDVLNALVHEWEPLKATVENLKHEREYTEGAEEEERNETDEEMGGERGSANKMGTERTVRFDSQDEYGAASEN